MDLLHHLLPQGGCRVHGVADPLVVLVAHPDGRAVIGGVACEVAVEVVVGGAGLAGDVHTAEPGGAAGAVDGILQHVRHQVGGGLLHGHPLLTLFFQHHGGVVVGQDLHIGPGLVVHAVVGEGGKGRRHIHGAQAVGQAAHAQGADVHVLRGQIQPQVLRGEVVGRRDSHLLQRLDRDGVDGVPDALPDGCPAGVGVGGVLGPGAAVEQPDGVVVKGGGRRDCAGVDGGRVGGQGLDGGTGLLDVRCVVPDPVSGLGPHVAHHGHDVAGGGLDDGDAGVDQLPADRGQVVQTAPVLVHGLGDLLDLRIQGRVDIVAAVQQPHPGLLTGDAPHLAQIPGDIVHHLVHEPGVDVDAAGGLGHDVLRGGVAVRELEHLRLGGLGLLRSQVVQVGDAHILVAAGHPVQDDLLAPLVGLPGGRGAPVLPGDGDGGHGTVQGGVVGDGDEAGALRHVQLGDVLAEVELRRGLDAVAALAQVDGVEIVLQDLLLGVVLLELQCPEDLPHLAVDGVAVVAGHVLEHLLGQGGAAVCGLGPDEEVRRGAKSALPVHALVLEEPVVLDGHGGLRQGRGHLVIVHPDAVLVAVDRLVLHPLPGLLVLIIDDGAQVHGIVVGVDVQRRGQGGLYVHHKEPDQHGCGAEPYQQQRSRHEDDPPCDTSRPFFLRFGFPAGWRLAAADPFFLFQRRAPPSFRIHLKSSPLLRPPAAAKTQTSP